MRDKVVKEVREFLIVFGLAVVLSTVISTQLFTFSQVKQSSMENTLIEGDVLFIDKLTPRFGTVEHGDIIVFVHADVDNSFVGKIGRLYTDMMNKFRGISNQNRLVKRVIGLPGDVINIDQGMVTVNGEAIDEPYLHSDTRGKLNGIVYPYEVPEGQFFAMGDNRPRSYDCRDFGAIDLGNIEGIARFRLFPFSKFGSLNNK